MMMGQTTRVAGLAVLISLSAVAQAADMPVEGFEPVAVPGAAQARSVDLHISNDLARVPRHYLSLQVTGDAQGPASVSPVLVDLLGRELIAEQQQVAAGEFTLAVDIEALAGRPVAMLRGVRLRHSGAALTIGGLRFALADEALPEPDVMVGEPRDDVSIQRALNSLGDRGGVVYIPAGTYILNRTVGVYGSNITIYGDGRATVLQSTWFENAGGFQVADQRNLRFSRLHLCGPPITSFRGYNQEGLAQPGDLGRPTVMSFGIGVFRCENVRVDHCEIELFGHSGVLFQSSTNCLLDHCLLHENFCCGFGYGLCVGGDTRAIFAEDNSFENNRHAVAAGSGVASYVARFNRMVNDAAVLPAWNQSPQAQLQLAFQQIDTHPGTGDARTCAHDNYVAMRNGRLRAGLSLRGEGGGWFFRNLIESAQVAISCGARAKQVWAWENEFVDCTAEWESDATGEVHVDRCPPDFAEIAYPHEFNRLGWWPGVH